MMKMDRQQVRKILLTISLLLFPVTINYFSPYLIIEGSIQGIIVGSFITFSAMFLGSLFLGRLFCGWMCPAGGLQELAFKISNKPNSNGRINWVKYIIWAPWISTIISMAIIAGGYHTVNPFWNPGWSPGDPIQVVSVTNIGMLVMMLMIIGIFLMLAVVFGRRGACHSICWMAPFMQLGRKISNLLRLPALRIRADKSSCVNCKKCTKNCPMSLDVNDMVQRETMENAECILCGTCIDKCPKKVLSYYFGRGK